MSMRWMFHGQRRRLIVTILFVAVTATKSHATQEATIGEVVRNQTLIMQAIQKQSEQTATAMGQMNAAINQTNTALALLTREMDERTKTLGDVNIAIKELTAVVREKAPGPAPAITTADAYLQRGAYGGLIVLTIMGSGWIITIRRNGKRSAA